MSSSYNAAWDELPKPAPHVRSGGSFWRKEVPVFREGTKIIEKGGMWAHQREFWEMENFIKILVTGYGGAKTNIICKRMISLALLNAPHPVALVSPSYPMAKLTTIPTIQSLLAGKQAILGRAFAFKYVGQAPITFRIMYRGRVGTLYILSAEKPLSLKGGNLAAAGMDEPFIQKEEVFEQMVARVRHPMASHREIVVAGTPEQLNWGYDLCEGELSDDYDVGVLHASTMHNLSLPDDYAKRLMSGYDERAVRAYVHGEFINLAKGAVYYGFDQKEHVIRYPRPSGSRLGVGMDFNVNPMACDVFHRRGDHMHIMKEYEFPNADTEYASQVLREEWGNELEDVYPDASGKARATNAPGGISDFTILRDQGFTVHSKSANPPRRDRFNAVNQKFKPANGKVTLTIDPSCKRLIKYFGQYTHEQMNSQEEMSHLLDAATYPIAYLWPVNKTAILEQKY